MIDRKDICDILLFKVPGINIAFNLDTMEIMDNPSNFEMPDDEVLQQWADEYDAHKATKQSDRVIVRDNILNAVAHTDEQKIIAKNMLDALLGIK